MAITKIQSESLNLADDFAFTGTITGAGGNMLPAFNAYSGDISLTSGVATKLSVTEVYDTDGAYNGTTFTVPSGQAGKYFFYVTGVHYAISGNATQGIFWLYKNGSAIRNTELYNLSVFRNHGITGNFSLELIAGDYIELYGLTNGTNPGIGTVNFGGYKIIE